MQGDVKRIVMWFVLCALRALKSHDCTFYAWFTLARKTENGIEQSAIFRRGKSWNMDVRIPEIPPPPCPQIYYPPECGRLLWTAPNCVETMHFVLTIRTENSNFFTCIYVRNYFENLIATHFVKFYATLSWKRFFQVVWNNILRV